MFQSLRMLSRKRISAPGRSGNSKRYSSSFFAQRRASADHVAHVQLGHLVVGEIERLQPVAAQVAHDARRFLAPRDLDADEDVRLASNRRCGS